MKVVKPGILVINGGSSSIKFALFDGGHPGVDSSDVSQPAPRLVKGKLQGVGQSEGRFSVEGGDKTDSFLRTVSLPDQAGAVTLLLDWIVENFAPGALLAIGHRVVHGGPRYWEPQAITPEMVDALRQLSAFDPEHLPQTIQLIDALQQRFPEVVQIACFDTAFHHDMPRVASQLPIPRKYADKGVRRYGFHGLSCAYMLEELARLGGPQAAQGRVILAHLGNGASVTAVRDGRSIDTSMGLTPAAGLPMSTRAGDLDPGLGWYLAQTEGMSAEQFHHMINHESGLLGVSAISADMRELLRLEPSDERAAEAVAMFCYRTRKCISAMVGALGGVDTLVFAGGIGEESPEIRARICAQLGFLGITLSADDNARGAAVVSSATSTVAVRVMRTDEEFMIAKAARQVLSLTSKSRKGTQL